MVLTRCRPEVQPVPEKTEPKKPKIKLTDKSVSKVKPPAKGREIHWDTEQKGFGLLVTDTGHKSFVVQYQVGSGRKSRTLRRMHLQTMKADDARTQAQSIIGDVARGRALRQPVDPLEQRRQDGRVKSGEGTFRAIATGWFKREGVKQRSGARRFGELERLAFPVLGDRQIGDINRKDVVKLLDEIEDTKGPGMADYILSAVRRVMSWYEGRNDDFILPIRRGMARTNAKERNRTRVLEDDELRAIWHAAEATSGPYGALLQFLLLTAVRREEAAQMRRSELSGSTWTIPAARYKTGIEHVVPLSAAALAIIDRLPRLGDGYLVFTVKGQVPFSDFTGRKRTFDKACGVTGWRLHDLRRTARSLMSRAGIDADIAERCLGHVIPGVRGVYDRYEYLEEKRHALKELAALIERIVNPPANNVVPLRSGEGAA